MSTLQRLFPALSAACLALGSGYAYAQTSTSSAAPAATPAPATTGPATVKPASGTSITDMSLSHAVNICELAVIAKVPVQTSLATAARAMAYVIKTQHGAQVASTATLTPEQLFDGSLIEIVTKVNSGCLSKLNATDQKTVSTLVAGINAAAKLQPAPAP
jgi:hypothetical protein